MGAKTVSARRINEVKEVEEVKEVKDRKGIAAWCGPFLYLLYFLCFLNLLHQLTNDCLLKLPMTHRTNSRKANGHAGPHDRPNGHAPASTERGGVPANWDQAASDDASGVSVASAAASPAAADLQPQASTDRKAYAEVAPPRPNGAPHDLSSGMSPASDKGKEGKKPHATGKSTKIPPGEKPLPADAGEFVQEIHRRIDLFRTWQRLLRSKDPKIRQRAAERLTDMFYKDAATSTEEPQQIIFDLPRPKRD